MHFRIDKIVLFLTHSYYILVMTSYDHFQRLKNNEFVYVVKDLNPLKKWLRVRT